MSAASPRLVPLGEEGWLVVLGDSVDRTVHRRVLELTHVVETSGIPGVLEVVPGYCTLAVCFDPALAPAPEVGAALTKLLQPPRGNVGAPPPPAPEPSTLHVIPVRYDGPDLEEVSRRTGLPQEEVVRRHSAVEYFVYLLGFMPGFAYLGDLDPLLALPRRTTPRTRVPAGSVAIAGSQAAVYPLATPGGWHLLGRTDTVMFDPDRNPAALLAPGDRVRFEPVA